MRPYRIPKKSWTDAGNYSFSVPDGITRLRVALCGGGAGKGAFGAGNTGGDTRAFDLFATGGEGASIDWTTADNQDVKVTANDLRMVIAAVAVRSNALHTAYRAAKEKVEAATTAAEVEAVTMEV